MNATESKTCRERLLALRVRLRDEVGQLTDGLLEKMSMPISGTAMSEEPCGRITSVALRECLECLPGEEREMTTVEQFLRQFEELGFEIADSARSMVERMLKQNGDTLDYDSVLAAADDLVACCNGNLERALDAMRVYQAVSKSR